ncbi:uncharacterized protein LOC135111453 [Scylla paramamosain]|uniref:uncharacterized protein LOC135111453 n=1 Tax=Scylla paramamosain TaxID=85552 RepID=UPI00308347E8
MYWWWVTESVKLPYLIMVGFIFTGFFLFCVCFCIDTTVNSSKYENLVDGGSHSKKKKKKKKETGMKERTQDIELDTFGQSSPPPYTPRGFRIETTWGREEDDSRNTPLVLRGSAAPWEGKAEGGARAEE